MNLIADTIAVMNLPLKFDIDANLLNPPFSDGENTLLQIFGKHILGQFIRIIPRKGEPSTLTFSSFVCSFKNKWYILTAGHIIQSLKEAVDAGGKIDTWETFDSFGPGKYRNSVSLGLELKDFEVLFDDLDQSGADIAKASISDFSKRALQANKVVPFDLAADGRWIVSKPVDQFYLVGLPSEGQWVKGRKANVAIVALPVRPLQLADVAAPLLQGSKRRFYGSIDHDLELVQLTTIDRMSGGPLIGIWFSEDRSKFAYAAIGVQSGWDECSKHIAAWPIDDISSDLANRQRISDWLNSRISQTKI